ncbi:MAG: hypothetical protein JWP11_646 [Frankiales bacterium]|jgi:hypothetical protein|nr:hypothetical protein [Frankiales bacterium]
MVRSAPRNPGVPSPRPEAVVRFRIAACGDQDIQAAYDRYRAVSGGLAPDLVASLEMVQARVSLTRVLLADGWKAPEVVLERLRLDEALLHPHVLVAS